MTLPGLRSANNQALLTARILGQPTAVVLIDTCSLLDILRQPIRMNIPSGTIAGALRLAERSQSAPRTVWVIASEYVCKEWADHDGHTRDEVEAHIKMIDRQTDQVIAVAKQFPMVAHSQKLTLASLALHQQLHNVAARLLESAEVFQVQDNHVLSAHQRLIGALAPAKTGKQEINDCVIIEQYLALCRSLRSGSLTSPCIFVSSNTHDYGTPTALRSPLDSEFSAVNLTYAVNFDHALTLM
jgi:PIN domain